MKTLQQHINEKLIINKKYKPGKYDSLKLYYELFDNIKKLNLHRGVKDILFPTIDISVEPVCGSDYMFPLSWANEKDKNPKFDILEKVLRTRRTYYMIASFDFLGAGYYKHHFDLDEKYRDPMIKITRTFFENENNSKKYKLIVRSIPNERIRIYNNQKYNNLKIADAFNNMMFYFEDYIDYLKTQNIHI